MLQARSPVSTNLRPTPRANVKCSAVRARWCLDAKYGRKMEAVGLLQEWVREVGSPAGLSPDNTRLSTGAIGAPESRLELEVTFDSVAEWESFLSRIPFKEHKAWSQRVQGMVVDGSPSWQLYRSVDIDLPRTSTPNLAAGKQHDTAAATAAPTSLATGSSSGRGSDRWSAGMGGIQGVAAAELAGSSSSLFIPSPSETSLDDALLQELARSRSPPAAPPSSAAPSTSPGISTSSAAAGEADGEVVLDWKGDPMVVRKGDRLPKFL